MKRTKAQIAVILVVALLVGLSAGSQQGDIPGQIVIEVLTDDGFQPLDYSIVGTVVPTVRIRGLLPEGYRVFNDRTDGRAGINGGAGGLGREITDNFDETSPGVIEGSLAFLYGANDVIITDAAETPEVLASVRMLNYTPDFEDVNGNGVLDKEEDVDYDGVLDEGEDRNGNRLLDHDEEIIANGVLDTNEDLNDNGVLDPGEDLNGNGVLDEALHEPVSSPIDPLGINYTPEGVPYQRGTILLSFQPGASDAEISVFLRERLLRPYALIVDETLEEKPVMVYAQIIDGTPAYVLERTLNGLAPDDPTFPPEAPPDYPLALASIDLVESLERTAGERLPQRLLTGDPPNAGEAYNPATGGFDNDGDAPDELDIAWPHFFMDTFAAHRLIDTLVARALTDNFTLSGVIDAVSRGFVRAMYWPVVAVIDSGFGNGVDADLGDIPVARLYRPTSIQHSGAVVQAPTLANAAMRDPEPGHGTSVALFAAGDGTNRILGTGKDVLLYPLKVDGYASSIGLALVRAARDPRVAVISLSWGPNNFDTNLDGRIGNVINENGIGADGSDSKGDPDGDGDPDDDGNGIVDDDPPGSELSRGRRYVLRRRFSFLPGINLAYANNRIIVAAAGNDGHDGVQYSYPGVFSVAPQSGAIDDDGDGVTDENAFPLNNAAGQFEDPPGVPFFMGVSATAVDGPPTGPEISCSFTNFGSQVSVSAPGDDIVGVRPSNPLRLRPDIGGTSYSTPYVSGLACELIYLDRNLNTDPATGQPGIYSAQQIVEFIEATADDLGTSQMYPGWGNDALNDKPGSGEDDRFGWGRINCWKAVLSTVNGGLADESHPIYGWFRSGFFGSLSRVSETETKWYGFKVITSVLGATAWINGKQLLEADPILPNPFPREGETQTASKQINAYAGVRSDQAILIGVDDDNDSVRRDDGDDDIRLDEDPTSGIVPVGNEGGEYIMTFSIERTDLIDEKGKPLTLSLRRPGQIAADAPFLNLKLDLEEMRKGSVPGVVFDDFVFEITPADFGDAPASYGTLLKDNGARHMNTNLEWLGKPGRPNQQSVSPEQDADSQVDQDGTPNILNGNPDLDRYDDGVVFFPLSYVPGKRGKVEFTVRVADPESLRYGDVEWRSLYVNGWIDWDTDGEWEEANGEHVVDGVQIHPRHDWTVSGVRSGQTLSLSAVGDGYATFTAEFTVPDPIGKGQLWARFRLDYGENVGRCDPRPDFRSDPSLRDPSLETFETQFPNAQSGYTHGAARFGEVEDYLIGADFGDAPDPGTGNYPTRQSQPSDGARHLDIYKEWLGDSKTREPDACLEAGAISADEDTHHGAPPNLHLDCKGQDGDLAEEFEVAWNGVTKKLQVMFTVHSTVSSRGYDLMGDDDDGDGLTDEDPFADEIDEDGDGQDGEDGPNVMSVLSLSPGTCSYEGFPVWSTPPWSGGKGRYQATRVDDDRDGRLDEDNVGGGDDDGDRLVDEDPSIVKPLFVNIYVDWNQDGDWDEPAEWALKDALIAPETFGADGKYTLGEPFEDRNHDGVWQSGEPFTDSAGNDSQTYACYFDAPITDLYTLLRVGPLGNALWVRIRLSYAETHSQMTPNASLSEEKHLGVIRSPQEPSLFPPLSEELIQLGICHSTEESRHLNKDRGGALAGEVEDCPIRLPYFSKAVDDTLIPLGGELTYTISLSNPNAYDIPDIFLFDPLPVGVSFISLIQAPPGIAFSPESNALGGRLDLGAFEDIQLSYTVDLTPQLPGGATFANCVTIEGPGFTGETCTPVTTVCEPPRAVARCRPSYATRYPRGGCGCEVLLREKALFDGQESSDPDGLIVSYSWDFGDGATQEGATVQHIYKRKGTFTACLTVTDDDDVADTVCCRVKVVRPAEPEPDFPPGDTW